MTKYDELSTLNITLEEKLKDRVEKLAHDLAIEHGWNGELKEKQIGKKPNNSVVSADLLEAGLEVHDLWGENWRDQLKVQSKPKWAIALEANQLKMLELIKNAGNSFTIEQQAEIEEIKESMDTEGMIQ